MNRDTVDPQIQPTCLLFHRDTPAAATAEHTDLAFFS